MSRVYLARHGETDWNVRRLVQGSTDTDLNAAGVAQATALGAKLVSEGITRIYSSEMRRARDTARIVAERLRIPVEVRRGLQELGLGEWEGRSWAEIRIGWPAEYAARLENRRNGRAPKGESYQEMLDRFVPVMVKIAREAQENVLVVTHSGCILAFLAELNRTPLERMTEDYSAPNAGFVAIETDRILARWPE